MIKYDNKERMSAINSHIDNLSIQGKTAFTLLTQHFKFSSIEQVADNIINWFRSLRLQR